jgi:hypothetical protein
MSKIFLRHTLIKKISLTFILTSLSLRNRLLDQGYAKIRLIRSLKKFIFRYQDLVEIYSVSAETIINNRSNSCQSSTKFSEVNVKNTFTSHFDNKYFWHFSWLPYLYTFSLYENPSFIIVSAETEYISTRSWYRNINFSFVRIIFGLIPPIWRQWSTQY